MTTALITGGAGFIGSHVAERFLAEGVEVHVLDNLITGKAGNVPEGASFHEVDIRDSGAADLVRTLRPDVLIHLAAQMDVRKSVAEPSFDAETNVVGSLNLLEAIRHHSPETRVVFSSTGGAIYGDFTTPPNVETFAKNPESPYAVAKLAVEHYLAYYGRVHGIASAVVRFANVYGPRQDPHGEAGVVAIFLGQLVRGEQPKIFGDGTQTRDYVYVGDVVRATLAAAGHDGGVFNIGTGRETSVVELYDLCRLVAGKEVEAELAPPRPGELQRSVLDAGRAVDELGWRPERSLEEGLRETWEWISA